MKTLRALNNEVYRWYQDTKKPVYIDCQIKGCHIIQKQSTNSAGWTYVTLANGEKITINWQATNANIFIDKMSDDIMDFLYEAIIKRERKCALEAYYFVNFDNNVVDSDFLENIFLHYNMKKLLEEQEREDTPLEFLQ